MTIIRRVYVLARARARAYAFVLLYSVCYARARARLCSAAHPEQKNKRDVISFCVPNKIHMSAYERTGSSSSSSSGSITTARKQHIRIHRRRMSGVAF